MVSSCLTILVGTIYTIYHVGIERGVFIGNSACSSIVETSNTNELLTIIQNTPIIRCDEPTIIFNIISLAELNLITMSIELKTNQTIDSILNNHRVWQKRKPLITNALKTHNYQMLQKLLLRLGRIDRSLKGMDNLDVYDELQNVVISLSGKSNGLNS